MPARHAACSVRQGRISGHRAGIFSQSIVAVIDVITLAPGCSGTGRGGLSPYPGEREAMPEHPSSTTWLDAHALDDDAFAGAYESLHARERAVLKKCIARLYQVWGELPSREDRTRTFTQGFGLEESSAPVPYVLLLCESFYASPAALLAALLPALLAGVEPVLPCFVPTAKTDEDARPVWAPLLAALELAGVERAFYAREASIQEFFQGLGDRGPDGRLVLLGGPSFGQNIALEAHRKGVPCRSLTRPSRYFSARLNEAAEQFFRSRPGEDSIPESLPASDEDVEGLFLSLDAAHEDIWFWPCLGPDWFRTKRMRFYSF